MSGTTGKFKSLLSLRSLVAMILAIQFEASARAPPGKCVAPSQPNKDRGSARGSQNFSKNWRNELKALLSTTAKWWSPGPTSATGAPSVRESYRPMPIRRTIPISRFTFHFGSASRGYPLVEIKTRSYSFDTPSANASRSLRMRSIRPHSRASSALIKRSRSIACSNSS